ncbi:hypothetical protein EET67_11875 [Pseudaminobacter arsenicus]|uniref:GNAT family N-acetyltransferase n=1 Tax=Borborobacter arsenicus TaxID=1851146 RepID=A0A432V6I1_9HYPH|nr:hypothetical protein [Pseudaminobacter arsenicus]RUM97755.1 hypothetical protein EET67_11875 [Pseudaminobacter arsenicus]
MSEIRPFAAADIPKVADMFQRILRKTDRPATPSLKAYLGELFLDPPDFDPDIVSLVHVRADGSVSGFLGALPMPMELNGMRLRAAVCGTMMVDGHAEDPFAGARLLRAFLAGPQDLSLTETANDVSTAMWRKMRATVLPDYSLEWLRVIRPAGFAAALAASRFGAAAMLAPLARPLDAFLHRQGKGTEPQWSHVAPENQNGAFSDTEADAERLLELFPALTANFPMRPQWQAETLRARIAHATRKANYGDGIRRVVSTRDGRAIGLFIYYGNKGGIGRVVQILAAPGQEGAVIDRMIDHAARRGLVALRGRVQPALLDAMMGRRIGFLHASSSIVHTRDPALIDLFRSGKAFFNGFAGESWARLIGDRFD